ncbi:MAG TPA: WYL domain-containing protein [Nocardioides sp.]|nr:WYL domain-containing protein [Nocardioides sp.]
MAKGPGRDQRAPMERLVRIAAVLHAHGRAGVSGADLAEVAEFTGEERMDQLARELRHLRSQGWSIVNVAEPGDPAHYVMETVDNRLTVRLTPGQQRALQQAVLVADRGDLVRRLGLPESARPVDVVPPIVPLASAGEALSAVVRATSQRARLRFTYKGTQRVVHPESVRSQNGTWYLRGREDGADTVKTFVVSRMSEVSVDPAGSAERVGSVRHPGLHPMSWEIDPPVDVELRTTPDFEPDVRRWLGEPAGVRADGGSVVLRYRVTNRGAFRNRLYEMGRRVELLGPPEVRAEVLAELRRLAGHEEGA